MDLFFCKTTLNESFLADKNQKDAVLKVLFQFEGTNEFFKDI